MKHIIFRTLVCAALAASLAAAQGPRGGGDPGQRLQRIAKELNLTDAQKEQLKPILEDEGKKFQELRADTSMDRQAKMEKFRQIQQDSAAKINPILNDDQKKKWDEMKEEGRERMRERRKQ